MAAEARDPLEVFPLEIWEIILENLREQGSSRDVLNCSNACTEFQRILEPTKYEWMFGTICPFILPFLKGRELLACRRVCKTWRHGVDNFLEDSETWQPFNEETSDISRSTEYDPLKQKKIKWTKIKNEHRLAKFLEAMEKEEMKIPFVGRSLSLGGWDEYEDRGTGATGSGFFGRAFEMLSLYGDHIWHLSVEPKDYAFDPYQFYQILKKILSCTPNLKTLILHLDGRDFLKRKDNKSALNNPFKFKDLPLPEINSLETLEINTIFTPPVATLEKVMTIINPENLRCLKLHHDRSYYVQPYWVVRPLQHLMELHVSGIHREDFAHIFNKIISPTAPLAKLSLDLEGVVMDVVRVRKIINSWKGTLKMLAVFVPASYSITQLDVPNLKCLEINGETFETDFLSSALESLEYLRIRYNDPHGLRDVPNLEFYNCVFEECELHDSWIWGEMKKLKVVRVQRSRCFSDTDKVACSREMHEREIPAKVSHL